MILDSNLTFTRAGDTPITTTKAIPIGQAGHAGNSKGLGAYIQMILNVSAAEDIPSMGVTLETSDVEAGPFTVVNTFPTKTGIKAGDTIVKERMSWAVRNWVRLVYTAAARVNAHLAIDADKKFPGV